MTICSGKALGIYMMLLIFRSNTQLLINVQNQVSALVTDSLSSQFNVNERLTLYPVHLTLFLLPSFFLLIHHQLCFHFHILALHF